MGMTYAQYYKRIDKKPTKKQLAQKRKVEKLYREIQFKKEQGEIEDKKQFNYIEMKCPHCQKDLTIYPEPSFNLSHTPCDSCGCENVYEVSYEILCKCYLCERVVYFRKGRK